MTLPTTTYSAHHGYSWSSIPPGLSLPCLTRLYRFISTSRGDFPDPDEVFEGFVSDGTWVGAFSIRNVAGWDAIGRASDYGAFAFFPVEEAGKIDLVELLSNDFFRTPMREPPANLDYTGPTSAHVPLTAYRPLETRQTYVLRNAHAIGGLLAKLAPRSERWIGLLTSTHQIKIECDPWISNSKEPEA